MIANDQAFSAAENLGHIETMGLAGFPPCARRDALAKLSNPVRLPEREAGQTTAPP